VVVVEQVVKLLALELAQVVVHCIHHQYNHIHKDRHIVL
jgi:energy-converting hydrogenase Eha subunit E